MWEHIVLQLNKFWRGDCHCDSLQSIATASLAHTSYVFLWQIFVVNYVLNIQYLKAINVHLPSIMYSSSFPLAISKWNTSTPHKPTTCHVANHIHNTCGFLMLPLLNIEISCSLTRAWLNTVVAPGCKWRGRWSPSRADWSKGGRCSPQLSGGLPNGKFILYSFIAQKGWKG